jgi:hypothetical protein
MGREWELSFRLGSTSESFKASSIFPEAIMVKGPGLYTEIGKKARGTISLSFSMVTRM